MRKNIYNRSAIPFLRGEDRGEEGNKLRREGDQSWTELEATSERTAALSPAATPFLAPEGVKWISGSPSASEDVRRYIRAHLKLKSSLRLCNHFFILNFFCRKIFSQILSMFLKTKILFSKIILVI